MKAKIENRKVRIFILLLIDLILINLSALIALKIGFNFEVSAEYLSQKELLIQNIPYYSILVLTSYYLVGLYRSLWQYASVKEMMSIASASILSTILTYLMFMIMSIELISNFYIINGFIILIFAMGPRFSYRLGRVFKVYYLTKRGALLNKKYSKVLIVGAGQAGIMVATEIRNYIKAKKMKIIIGFLDDDKKKIGSKVMGLPVIGNIDSIEDLMTKIHIDEIIIAIPSLKGDRKKEIFDLYKHLNVQLHTVPGLYSVIDGKIKFGSIRKVSIEDLLGRDPIKLCNPEILDYIKGKRIMVTGGGGSIGSELCRQLAILEPELLIIFDIYENNAYDIQNELIRKYGDNLKLKVLIGSVRDRGRLEEVFEKYRPDLVYHAAAHKHVPLMQDSPFEAIKNNSIGTVNTADMAGKYGAERFILISTDKAVNPTNIMGASKRLAELGLQSLNSKHENTELMAVRFGNVLGSNGSVIPLFKEQIRAGGPVTVTHPDVIRYFMTIPEAVELVLQSSSMARGGEVFVLDMGEPVRILDLAKDLIRLSGFEPFDEIDIEFVGMRPGEKLFEELLLDEEDLKKTPYKKIFVIGPADIEIEYIDEIFISINRALKEKDLEYLEKCVADLIPNYRKISEDKGRD